MCYGDIDHGRDGYYHLLWILLGSAAMALLLTLAGCATTPTNVTNGIPNFHQVSTGIYRGGQPTLEGWKYLKSLGVTNVIKLNEISEASDQPAIDLGMTVKYHPINIADQVLLKPNKKDFLEAVSQITHGTYVHCEHGQDRTGLAVGTYRVLYQHIDKPSAYKEMLDFGFHKSLHGLDDFWEDDVK
jgi:protein tyrosine/serine phosphatase